MRIAVYSGSFNPLHIGHKAIMEYLTGEGLYDKVYLVVSPQNPFKDSSNALSGHARYEAAIKAVSKYPELKVHVDDIELNMTPPHYTIKTLDALKKREPDNEFTLVMGADNLDCILKWRDGQRILADYGVAVYPRSGFDLESIRKKLLEHGMEFPAPYVLDDDCNHNSGNSGKVSLEDILERQYKIRILDAPIVDMSSTMIREGIARGEDMSAFIM